MFGVVEAVGEGEAVGVPDEHCCRQSGVEDGAVTEAGHVRVSGVSAPQLADADVVGFPELGDDAVKNVADDGGCLLGGKGAVAAELL